MIRDWLREFLMSESFQTIGLIILPCVMSVVAKKASKNDKYKTNKWNDYAFGLDIIIASSLLWTTRSIDALSKLYEEKDPGEEALKFAKELSIDIWVVVGWMVGIWVLTLFIRERGWKNGNDLNFWSGVFIPDLIGIAVLYLIV